MGKTRRPTVRGYYKRRCRATEGVSTEEKSFNPPQGNDTISRYLKIRFTSVSPKALNRGPRGLADRPDPRSSTVRQDHSCQMVCILENLAEGDIRQVFYLADPETTPVSPTIMKLFARAMSPVRWALFPSCPIGGLIKP